MPRLKLGPILPPNIPVAPSAGLKNPLILENSPPPPVPPPAAPAPPPNKPPIPPLRFGPKLPPNIPFAPFAGLKKLTIPPFILENNPPPLAEQLAPPAATAAQPATAPVMKLNQLDKAPPTPGIAFKAPLIAGPKPGINILATPITGAAFLTTFFTDLNVFFNQPNSGIPVMGLIDIPSPTVYSSGDKPAALISASIRSLVSGELIGGTTISPWAT